MWARFILAAEGEHDMDATVLAVMIAAGAASADRLFTQCIAARAQGFSGVAAVVGPEGVIFYASGDTGGAGAPALTADSRFNLGSAGKMFTAVAVAQLID